MIPRKCVLRYFHNVYTNCKNRLCVSRDVNKMHMAERGVPEAVDKFLFLRQNDEHLS